VNENLKPAVFGLLVGIAITTTMDATGYSMFSALPLFPLAGLFWYLQRFSRREVGLVWGKLRAYIPAVAYPMLVLGLMGVIAWVFGDVDTSDTDWNKALLNMALMSSTGIIMVLITEEGFFRGWLWAALNRAGQSDKQVLVWTSLAFTLWHVSAISLDTGFDVPAAEIPIYLINATLVGAVFGMLRMASGSIVAPSICHAVWNGIDYPLFGFGEKAGALGIEQTHIYGPEVGVLGIALNAIFATALWFWITRANPASTAAACPR
jgi:membrane protease YdiL (CAAX protease family)